jgi:hypothetical protein
VKTTISQDTASAANVVKDKKIINVELENQ